MKQLMTSLVEIYSFKPCASGWKCIKEAQRAKGRQDHEPFPLIECCDSNNFSDVCWLLGKRKTEISIVVRAAELCAKSVANLENDYAADAADAAAAAAAANYAAAAYTANADYTAADYTAAAAVDAADYAAAAYTAAYAANANYAAAAAAAYTAAYAANADYAAAAAAAFSIQNTKNMNFLRQAIQEYENANISS